MPASQTTTCFTELYNQPRRQDFGRPVGPHHAIGTHDGAGFGRAFGGRSDPLTEDR
jgi:hypothetical protein